LQIGNGEFDLVDVIAIASGIFAIVLLSLSTYAWLKRKQTSLILVSAVFLVFVFRIAIETILPFSDSLQLILEILDFVILGLLFIAIVVPPRLKRFQKVENREKGA
jgi:hypothetical protein